METETLGIELRVVARERRNRRVASDLDFAAITGSARSYRERAREAIRERGEKIDVALEDGEVVDLTLDTTDPRLVGDDAE